MSDNPWASRFQAVARAQARYLYLLLVLCIFFWALRGRLLFAGEAGEITLPIVNVPVSGYVPLVLAPAVLALVLLAVLGTFPASREAYSRLAETEKGLEAYNSVPTAIDFVVYSRSNGALSRLSLLSYPAALTLAYVEAAWLWGEALEYHIVWQGLAQFLGLLLLLACLPRLAWLWKYKMERMIGGKASS